MKNIKIVSLLCMVCTGMVVSAQSPNWLWAKAVGGAADYYYGINHSCTDNQGNIYMTGSFMDSAVTFGNYTVTKEGNDPGFFLTKFDASGNALWAKSVKGSGEYVENTRGAGSIGTDAGGNVYLAGTFLDDTITIGNSILVNAGDRDIFLVKYNSSGDVVWAKSAGGSGNDFSNKVIVDAFGDIYLTGSPNSPYIVFGQDTLMSGSFLVKYNSSGDVIWAKGVPYGCMNADASGNIYLAGGMGSDTLVYGNDTVVATSERFLIKYNSSGNITWAKGITSTPEVWCHGLSVDGNGNAFIVGRYLDTIISFDGITLIDTNNNIPYSSHMFVVKYDVSGNVVWAKGEPAMGLGISCDADGNVYVTGGFNDPDFSQGSIPLIVPDTSGWNSFIAKYNPLGDVIWKEGFGGVFANWGTGLCTDVQGDVYLTGVNYSPTLTFGDTTLSIPYGTSYFLAKFNNNFPAGMTGEGNSSGPVGVYPNPTAGNICFNGLQNGNTVEIYNALGKIVCSAKSANAIHQLNLNGKAKGIYFYRIADNASIVQQGKIVVE